MTTKTKPIGPLDAVKIGDVVAVVGPTYSGAISSIAKRMVVRVTTTFFVLNDDTKFDFWGRRKPWHGNGDRAAFWGPQHDEILKDIRARKELLSLFGALQRVRDSYVEGRVPVPEGFVDALKAAVALTTKTEGDSHE